MGDGQKKAGLRDISDLKARLGMLNKNVGARPSLQPTPAAPAPAETPEPVPMAQPVPVPQPFAAAPDPQYELGSTAAHDSPLLASPFAPATLDLRHDPDADVDESTAIVRIDARERDDEARATIDEMPYGVDPPPAGFSPFEIGNAAELFRKPDPVPESQPDDPWSPHAARPEPTGRSTETWTPTVQADVVGPAAYPDAVVADLSIDDLPIERQDEELPENDFAHPLQRGQYSVATAPVDLSAEEEAALASFEGGQQGMKRSMAISLAVVVGVFTLVIGFTIGDSLTTRQLLNAQIDQAVMVRERLNPLLDQFESIAQVVERMAHDRVDWDRVEALPLELPGVEAGALLSVNPPLPDAVTRLMGNAVVDLGDFFQLVLRHRDATLRRDQANLKAIEDGDAFSKQQYFAVIFRPLDPKTPVMGYIPPEGSIVAITGKPEPNEKGDDMLIGLRTRAGKDKTTSVRNIIRLNREDVVGSKGSVMDLYTRRVQTLRQRMKVIRGYVPSLREQLQEAAARQKVLSF